MLSKSIDSFFLPDNFNENTHNLNDKEIDIYTKCCRAFSRLTNESLYLVDYSKKSFIYVSDNPIFLCGFSAKEVKDFGYAFYEKVVSKEDFKLLIKINEAGFAFYKKLPSEEKLDYSIYYNFHIIQPSGKQMLIQHKLTPLVINLKEQISLALCSVSLSSEKTSGNIIMHNHKHNKSFFYNIENEKWKESDTAFLKEKEKEVLFSCMQGYTSIEISEIINSSVDTVKFHKKNIIRKFDVENMTEAIAYAFTHKVF